MNKNNLYRILTPSEFTALRDAIPKTRLRILVDTMMFTGMRYRELIAFSKHLTWFDAKNNAIVLPASFSKTRIDRTVHLTPAFSKALAQYLREFKSLEFGSRQTMTQDLKRWSGDMFWDRIYPIWHPTPKTFRKTWESWLIFAGYEPMKVALSQGHSQVIQMHHYANLTARLKSEREAGEKMCEGWGT